MGGALGCCRGSTVKVAAEQDGSLAPEAQKGATQPNGAVAPHDSNPNDVPSNKPPPENMNGNAEEKRAEPAQETPQQAADSKPPVQKFGTAKSVKRMLPEPVKQSEASTAYTRSESSKSLKEKMAKIEANEFVADDVPSAEKEVMTAELSAPVIAKPGMTRLQSSKKMMLDRPPQVLGYAVKKQVQPSVLAMANQQQQPGEPPGEPADEDLPEPPAAKEV